jgi:hypothetical protein
MSTKDIKKVGLSKPYPNYEKEQFSALGTLESKNEYHSNFLS